MWSSAHLGMVGRKTLQIPGCWLWNLAQPWLMRAFEE